MKLNLAKPLYGYGDEVRGHGSWAPGRSLQELAKTEVTHHYDFKALQKCKYAISPSGLLHTFVTLTNTVLKVRIAFYGFSGGFLVKDELVNIGLGL